MIDTQITVNKFQIKYLFQQQWTTRTKNDTSDRDD